MTASHIDPARWALLSPWLDELIDADTAQRAATLDRAAAHDPELADALRQWVAKLDAQDHSGFMQASARHPTAADAAGAGTAGPAGQRVGAYVVQHLLGQGGMGSVWLAQRADGRYDGQVAIKFLHGGLFGRGDAKRFAREGQILARLDHPHIARLLDAGLTADDGQPYLVLEFVQGLAIDTHVQQQGLDARATVGLFMDVLAAVSHAHERLILHRDLKPSNILVTPQGQVKLLDFGIAKLVSDALEPDTGAPATQLTQQAGRAYTLRYAAPEQVQHGEATTATDVYALGVLLHVLLTGGLHPTSSSDSDAPLAQLQALVHTVARRPSDAVAKHGGPQAKRLTRALQGDLDTILGRALKKQPAERYRNAAEMADDLRRYLAHEPIAARPDSAAYRMGKFLRRNRWGVAAAGSVMLALGVGTVLALQSARAASAQRAVALQQRAQAESLIAFMLEDLRPKLESVNRLDVMDAVGTKVLQYYEQRGSSDMDADALGRRGQALTLLGRMAQKRGQLAEAERSLTQAVASLTELLRREPGNAQRLFDAGAGLNALAVVQRMQGQLAKAEASNRQSLALHVRARALQSDPTAQRKLVESQFNLANFYLLTGRPGEALPLLTDADAGALGLTPSTPTAWITLANIRAGIADGQFQLGRIAESIATVQTQFQVLAQVPAFDTNSRAQEMRGAGLARLAGSQLAIGLAPEAADSIEQAVQVSAALVANAPDSADAIVNLVRRRVTLSETLAWEGHTAQAQAQLQQAQTELQGLLKRPQPLLDWRLRSRGGVLLQRARLNPGDPDLPAELQAYLAEFAIPQASGVALTLQHSRVLAQVGLQLGNVLALRHRAPEAQAAWRTALAELERAPQDGFPPELLIKAQLHWRMGNAAKAQALMAAIDKGEFRHPEYVAFKQSVLRAGGNAGT